MMEQLETGNIGIGDTKQRPFYRRRPEGNLLDRRVAQRRGPLDLRCGEDGGGSHSWTARFNPQGDVGTTGIRQRQEGDGRNGKREEVI